jgi:DNA-binding LytR/AlgR family response regulator
MKLNCIIVEDEHLAQNILVRFISAIDTLVLVSKCNNALEALSVLHTEAIDIMFLDIKMPELSGLELLKSLPHPPHVIITTAYAEYALMGYELSVTDYLLKPFSFERFLRAVNKVIDYRKAVTAPVVSPARHQPPADIILKTGKKNYKFALEEILYLESFGNYVKVYTNQGMSLLHQTLSHFLSLLPESHFVRIHRSYIVALAKIDCIEASTVRIGSKNLPVGSYYKQSLRLLVDQWTAHCKDQGDSGR